MEPCLNTCQIDKYLGEICFRVTKCCLFDRDGRYCSCLLTLSGIDETVKEWERIEKINKDFALSYYSFPLVLERIRNWNKS